MAKKLYGTDPDQVPTNADLGTIAYQDKDNVHLTGRVVVSAVNPAPFTVPNASESLEINDGSTTKLLMYADNSNAYIQASKYDGSNPGRTLIFATKQGTNGISAESARFNVNGNLAFPSGQGIDFSASEGSGASSSVLDDYEEGTWTPSFTNLTIGNGTVFGTYTKIGRSVTVVFGFKCGSTTSVGTLGDITGLPFTSSNDYTGFIKVHGVAFDSGSRWYEAVAVIGNNSSSILVPSIANYNSSISSTNPMTWTTNDTLVFTATYTTT